MCAGLLALCADAAKVWDVTDFGAREGDALQTAALQRAIDACFTAGGGEVRVPAGVYRTGGLRLRSGVTLHLLSGAVLRGSRNPDDYEGWRADALEPIPPATATNGLSRSCVPQSRWCNGLIRAYGAHDVAIVGEAFSEIDGRNCFDPQGEEGYRGPHAVSMWYCTNVVLRGYTVRDSANWAHAIFNSSNIAARAVKVFGGHDGFDVRTCDDVRVEACVFQTGDDGIAGFDNIGVVVRDCVFTRPERVFSLDFDGKHRWCCNRSLQSITFENCTFDGVASPLHIHGDAAEPLTLTMRGCTVVARAEAAQQAAIDARHFRAIVLEDTTWKGFARPRLVVHTPGAVSVKGGTPLETVRP